METNKQIGQNKAALENLEEAKKPSEALSDEALDQVSGGMKIQMDDEAAATKGYRSKR